MRRTFSLLVKNPLDGRKDGFRMRGASGGTSAWFVGAAARIRFSRARRAWDNRTPMA